MQTLTTQGMMRLQGIPPSRIQDWPQHITKGEMPSMIGNSFSANVLERAMREVLSSLGLRGLPDRWVHAATVNLA